MYTLKALYTQHAGSIKRIIFLLLFCFVAGLIKTKAQQHTTQVFLSVAWQKAQTASVNNAVNIKWSASDDAISHYVIQRSFGGKEFSDRAILFITEDNVEEELYSFRDKMERPYHGKVYYRLKKVMQNGGGTMYSNVVSAEPGKENTEAIEFSNTRVIAKN